MQSLELKSFLLVNIFHLSSYFKGPEPPIEAILQAGLLGPLLEFSTPKTMPEILVKFPFKIK